MQLIKNALIYRASLPDAATLALHLQDKPFTPVLPSHAQSCGFIANPHTEQLVSEFPGGYAVRLRSEYKKVSKKALALALQQQTTEREQESGASLKAEEVAALREAIYADALKAALPERIEVEAYYHQDSRLLLVATTSKDLASQMMMQLVEACGAVETATIHVSDVKGGLTTRLTNYFENDQRHAFDGFTLGDAVQMKGEAGSARFDLDNLDHARSGVLEALTQGMQVERLALSHADAVGFRLTKDFQLRSVHFFADVDGEDCESMADFWRLSAGTQVLLLAGVVQALCDLFGYQPPEEAAPAGDEASDEAELYRLAVTYVRESKRASVSAVQRHLKVGYNRAARLIEAMEREGVITPMNENGARSVNEVPA